MWYQKTHSFLSILLLPFSWIFNLVIILRRHFYRMGLFKTIHFNIPVIIVGNLTVGGTGKTPFVIWLADFLKSQGYSPGIVSRGVGGNYQGIHHENPEDSPDKVGDEALLLSCRTHCPVVIGVDRVQAVRELLKVASCDIVLSDDGLQHDRLGRSLEIVIVDGKRRFGNQSLLPAGPLREGISRLQSVDLVVVNGGDHEDESVMHLHPDQLVSMKHADCRMSLQDFPHAQFHAVAGIGHPERFFDLLGSSGFKIIPHSFPDHYAYRAKDLDFQDQLNIVMTEKDAVKCRAFADERYWYLRINAKISQKVEKILLMKLALLEKDNEKKKFFSSTDHDLPHSL
jgi:tetraacyldisaccharide 4'-kinase